MAIFRRIKNLWELSKIEVPAEEAEPALFRKEREMAEFLVPNRAEEILKGKPNASIDDILT